MDLICSLRLMKGKHTPGPWKFGGQYSREIYHIETGRAICKLLPERVFGEYNPLNPTIAANARLIEAAPKMVEALEALVKAAPNEMDMQRLLKFSGLDDVTQLKIKTEYFGYCLERADKIVAAILEERAR